MKIHTPEMIFQWFKKHSSAYIVEIEVCSTLYYIKWGGNLLYNWTLSINESFLLRTQVSRHQWKMDAVLTKNIKILRAWYTIIKHSHYLFSNVYSVSTTNKNLPLTTKCIFDWKQLSITKLDLNNSFFNSPPHFNIKIVSSNTLPSVGKDLRF